MKHFIALAMCMGLSLGCAANAAEEKEEKEQKIKLTDAPAAVQKTIKAQAGDQKIDMIEKDVENGKTIYEAEIMVDGKRKEITVGEDGKLIKDDEDGDDDHEDKDDDDDKEDDDKGDK